jgi:ribosomal protein S18 acetylase RimI-like enzyme
MPASGDNAVVSLPVGPAFSIRQAREADVDRLPIIERDAGAPFREIGMNAVADGDVPTRDELLPHVAAGRVWVAVDDGDTAVGYLIVDLVDGHAHVEQVSVLPACSRRGIGRALVEQALIWAGEQEFDAVTLTTFTEVAWNGPYYQRLGFRFLNPGEVGPELQQIRLEEARKGLDEWPRASMVKAVCVP